MSRKGNCYDNCIMETFFGRLKNEMFYGFEKDYPSYTKKVFDKDADNNCYIVKGDKLMNPAKLLRIPIIRLLAASRSVLTW